MPYRTHAKEAVTILQRHGYTTPPKEFVGKSYAGNSYIEAKALRAGRCLLNFVKPDSDRQHAHLISFVWDGAGVIVAGLYASQDDYVNQKKTMSMDPPPHTTLTEFVENIGDEAPLDFFNALETRPLARSGPDKKPLRNDGGVS